MASICSDPGGRKRILFIDRDGVRRTVRLGKVTGRIALAVRLKVEAMVAARLTGGTVDDEVSRWVGGIGDDLHAKLATVGLVEPRVAPVSTSEASAAREPCVGDFLDGYLRDRDDLKPNSLLVYGHTRRTLVEFFGREKALKDITEYDAEQWQRYLMRQGLSKATVRKRTANAKVFFRVAVKQKLIPLNPFQDLKSTSVGNDDRLYFLSHRDAQKVLDACPDAQWRLIFALCRYGGFRCPSEVLGLKWSDVNWEQGRILIHSPKTEHHEGHETRLIPMFPELRPHLLAAFEEAEPGSEYAVTHYRKTNSNLRTQLERIIKRAGLQPWPRTFQNLRSSRETELAESYPLHVVTAWIGNSKAIAAKHYLQIRDEDFDRAARIPTKAAQNPAQSGAESGRKAVQTHHRGDHAIAVFPVKTADCELMQVLANQRNGDEGNRTLIPAMRPPCAPVTPRPQGSLPIYYGVSAECQELFNCFCSNHLAASELPFSKCGDALQRLPTVLFRGVGGVAEGQQFDDRHVFRDADDRPDLVGVEGADPAGGQAKLGRLQADVLHRDGDVDGTDRLAATHDVVADRTGDEDCPGVLQESLVVCCGGDFLLGLAVRNDDEPPILEVLGRRGRPGGLQHGEQFLPLDRLVLVVAAGPAGADRLCNVHVCIL